MKDAKADTPQANIMINRFFIMPDIIQQTWLRVLASQLTGSQATHGVTKHKHTGIRCAITHAFQLQGTR
jgi:hypothetical protein